jgi:uncharacterized protein YndB with AHSA1/START domain
MVVITPITIKTVVDAPIGKVWDYWTNPKHITKWNYASPTWHSPRATNDLRVGGVFTARMEAKDGSRGFDFSGRYTEVVPLVRIAYVMEDGRAVTVDFQQRGDETQVTETFDPETENPLEMQRQGWQSILTHFKIYTENR